MAEEMNANAQPETLLPPDRSTQRAKELELSKQALNTNSIQDLGVSLRTNAIIDAPSPELKKAGLGQPANE